jgi:hypothetical protein
MLLRYFRSWFQEPRRVKCCNFYIIVLFFLIKAKGKMTKVINDSLLCIGKSRLPECWLTARMTCRKGSEIGWVEEVIETASIAISLRI